LERPVVRRPHAPRIPETSAASQPIVLSMSRLLCLGLLLLAQQSRPLNDEKQLLAGIKAPPGFAVTIFAAPPDVGYPTCLAAVGRGGEAGRVSHVGRRGEDRDGEPGGRL